MIRVVVTVLLAIALIAASLPAVEHAAADRSEEQVRDGIESIDAAATELLRSEEVVPGTTGARRTVTVRLPVGGIAARSVDRLTISASDRRYSYRVEGRTDHELLGAVPVHTLDDDPLVLRESGTHELVLALVRIDGDRRVVIVPREHVDNGALGGDSGSAPGRAEVQD